MEKKHGEIVNRESTGVSVPDFLSSLFLWIDLFPSRCLFAAIKGILPH